MVYDVNMVKETIEGTIYELFNKVDNNHNILHALDLEDTITNLEIVARRKSSRLDTFIDHIYHAYAHIEDMMYHIPMQYVSDVVLCTLQDLQEDIMPTDPVEAYDKLTHKFRNYIHEYMTTCNMLYTSHITEVFMFYYNEYCKVFELTPKEVLSSDFANITDCMYVTIVTAMSKVTV